MIFYGNCICIPYLSHQVNALSYKVIKPVVATPICVTASGAFPKYVLIRFFSLKLTTTKQIQYLLNVCPYLLLNVISNHRLNISSSASLPQ